MNKSDDLHGLLPLLTCIDRRLEQAIATLQAEEAPTVSAPYQGLVQPDEGVVAQMLQREPGAPRFAPHAEAVQPQKGLNLRAGTPIAWVQQTFALSLFELEVVAIALAPELDRRYEQIYAYLQDDVRRKRPTVDLALNLLCASPAEKLAQRRQFSSQATLIARRLLHVRSPGYQENPTLLGHELQLDDSMVRLLLIQLGLDRRMTFCCTWGLPTKEPEHLSVGSEVLKGLKKLLFQPGMATDPLRFYFQGNDAVTKRQVAEHLAGEATVPLLMVNLAQLQKQESATETLSLIFREAWFQQGWLYFDGLDKNLAPDKSALYQQLLSELKNHSGVVILSGEQVWGSYVSAESAIEPMPALGVISISFPMLDFAQRHYCWQTHLASADLPLAPVDLAALADRFRLAPHQIAAAVAAAKQSVRWQASLGNTTPLNRAEALFQAARSQSGHDLTTLAQKVDPIYSWADLVLPEELMAQLHELCQEAGDRHLVWEQWGFDRKLSLGKGLTVLFSGLPGTGKTMAAEVIAQALQQDLYKIDLSQMVSKYIGETEKNLNRVFTAAASSNAILLFDEADALFGKRSEVKDARDRYANIETSYLLQKMEEYAGIAILTTNLRSNIDEAFVRRLRFILDFPLPQAAERQRIWAGIWPAQVPLSPNLDFKTLAQRFELSGAVIRNVALRAAFLAANDEGIVAMSHILKAIRREYQKIGKLLTVEQMEI